MSSSFILLFSFSFNATSTTEIYTLSLHDALPISLRHSSPLINQLQSQLHLPRGVSVGSVKKVVWNTVLGWKVIDSKDRKSTRLNSSHITISYAVFCLKKKN